MDLPIGSAIDGRYRIESILHTGSRSVIAAGSMLSIDKRVAIKALHMRRAADAVSTARFMQSVRLLSAVTGDHVVMVFDMGYIEGQGMYQVLELLEGQDLATTLANSGPIHPAFAVELLLQTCEGLAAIHACNIVHRAIQPSNLFVGHRAGQPWVTVLDFFFAREIGQPVTRATGGELVGTPPYAAPEQLRDPARVDARADIWSLGIVACELVAALPYTGSFGELIAAVHDATPPTIPDVIPPALASLIRRCLERDPDARYQTVADVADALVPLALDPQQASRVAAAAKALLATRA